MTYLLAMIMLPFILLSSCSKGPKQDEALAAHNVATQTKEQWTKVEKPVEIEIEGRSQKELADIGSITAVVNGTPMTFTLRDSVFVPVTSMTADSSVVARSFYPCRSDIIKDTLTFSNPLPPILIGEQTAINQSNDKITIKMKLNEITALLRIKLESDNLTDMLVKLNLSGSFVTSMREPNSGKWLEVRATNYLESAYTDCILNNGRVHTFNLIPTEEASTLGVQVVTQNGTYSTNVEIPPLRSGSVTDLRLRLVKGKVSVGSSWVDTKHEFVNQTSAPKTVAEVGNYLQSDGTISKVLTDESVAVVIETDGTHGKAVALTDNNEANVFMGKDFDFGAMFDTVDGKYSEGCFNASMAIEGESVIAFSPSANYPNSSAFSAKFGAPMTFHALSKLCDSLREEYLQNCGFPTAYVPTLFELAELSAFVSKHKDSLPEGFQLPTEFCISCCEKDKHSFYSLYVPSFRITSYNSKEYSTAALRLFYIF